MTNTEFLEQLKVGDEVLMESRYNKSFGKVVRITKTQIVVELEIGHYRKFNKNFGNEVGSSRFGTTYIKESNEQVRKTVELESIKSKFLYNYRLDIADKSDLQILQCHAYLKGNGFIS